METEGNVDKSMVLITRCAGNALEHAENMVWCDFQARRRVKFSACRFVQGADKGVVHEMKSLLYTVKRAKLSSAWNPLWAQAVKRYSVLNTDMYKLVLPHI